MLYDQFFDLMSMQEQATRPLSTIALHEAEEYGKNGPLYTAIEQYSKSAVSQFFPGLSVDRFLGLPLEMCNFLLEISERRRLVKIQEDNNAATAGEKHLKDVAKGLRV